jgi:uncharacterized protein (DUF342 family)
MSTATTETATTEQLIDGNVDASRAKVDAPADLRVSGNVCDGTEARARGDVRVGGMIEAARVQAGGGIEVAGGISGKGRGSLSAGGDIVARYVMNAAIETLANVRVEVEASNSTITALGRVTVERRALSGGSIIASDGIERPVLGAASGTKMTVEVGTDEFLRRREVARLLPDITAKRKKADHTRSIVKPLLANQKALTAQQKEKATELLFEADELSSETDRMLADLRKAYEAWLARNARCEIVVAETIHPGVTIRFPGLETVVEIGIKGPVRIVPQRIDNERRIVVIDGKTTFPLKTFNVPDAMDALRTALGITG